MVAIDVYDTNAITVTERWQFASNRLGRRHLSLVDTVRRTASRTIDASTHHILRQMEQLRKHARHRLVGSQRVLVGSSLWQSQAAMGIT